MTAFDVTVVIPHFQQHAQLALTLAVLDHQTHPAERLQVVVADDGSSPPVHGGLRVGYDLVVRSQEHDGFGLARARNLGAEVADGTVVIFLDADMLPEPGFVAAHRDAVAADDSIVSIGHRIHVDVSGLAPIDVVRAVESDGGLESLFDERHRSEPAWRADHLSRTNDLEDDFAEAYRVASGGNLSLWRDFYRSCGGTDPTFRQWGGEDLEFAFRATQHGATFVYTRAALAWHQGLESVTDEAERRSQREQRPLLANRIADRHLRDQVGGRIFTVPQVSVEIEVTPTAGAESVEMLVDGLLRHPLGCEVWITGADPAQQTLLERAFVADPRVRLGDLRSSRVPPSVVSPAPVRVAVDMEEPVIAASILAAIDRLSSAPRVGVVRIGDSVIYRQEEASRVLRRHRTALTTAELVNAIAADAGEDRIEPGAVVPGRVPGAGVDGADVLREIWWRLSPNRRRLVERSVLTGRARVGDARRLLRRRR